MDKRVYCLFLILQWPLLLVGQHANYQLFENIMPGNGVAVATCFIQDKQGLIWVGTDKGLFSYDGYSTQPHFKFDKPSNIRVNCGVFVGSDRLFLGTDNGILIYNLKSDHYEKAPLKFPADVRTMALNHHILWIGTLNGLYWYDFTTGRLKYFNRRHYKNLPHKTIYSIIRSHDGRIFIGTYNGLCVYSAQKDDFQRIVLPLNQHRNNQFINSLLEDQVRHCIWIGTEGNLLKYNLSDGITQPFSVFRDNSIKSLALDGSGRLLIGTDNGLYVYKESEQPQHLIHDSRNLQSLSNNIVWAIFTDRERNVWLGTDEGISLSRCNPTLQYVPISQITGSGEGCQFYSIFRDSKGFFWFGGTNGLIKARQLTLAAWYKMGSTRYPLSHNRIRNIYQDREGELWIATDGGINRYDYGTSQFVHYNIVDRTGTYNANWAYFLFEDANGQLWIATCLGGIFVVNKHRLMQSQADHYVADYNFSSWNGLTGMFINQIVPDKQGHVWVLLYNNGIDRIDIRTRKVLPVNLQHYTGGRKPNYLLCDQAGIIWIGYRGGVVRINPQNQQIRSVRFDAYSNTEILSMAEVEGGIWISTTDGFCVIDKQTQKFRHLNLSEKRFTSLFYDKVNRKIYLGGLDGLGITSPDVRSANRLNRPIIATAIIVNNSPFESKTSSIRYANQLKLKYDQNNVTVDFSDLPYSMEEKSQFAYRLEGLDNRWNQLAPNTNRISYSNLDYGSFRLIVSKLNEAGKPSGIVYTLGIRISPPWYYTPLAKSIYMLLILSLIVWTINFFRVKNRLKIEHIEKEKILEQSRMKIDFFAHLSREMKMPLSMIIAPISKILPDVQNQDEKRQLMQVQQNAMKLNAQIHQMLDFNRMDSDADTLLILSKADLVPLSRRIVSFYEQAGKDRHIVFHFKTNREIMYMDIDVIKWESILNNLLTNAMNFLPAGGEVTFSLAENEENQELEARVSDTGVGIPAKDIPYIFQRFFQSSKTVGKKGTGVGLYLVKTYTELLGGKVSLTSKENTGTTITLTIPIRQGQVNQPIVDLAGSNRSTDALAINLADQTRPLVLVVEDNPEIATFIARILDPGFSCQITGHDKAGLELCLQLKPHLVISDIMGLDLCQQLRQHVPTSTIPIILLATMDDKETELKSIHLNIDAFIPMPFQPDILLSRVSQLIHKSQTLEAKIRIEAMTSPKEIEAVSYDEKFLASITKIIEDHLDDADLNVSALCELSGINNKQIYRKTKQLTGMTPVDYIRSIRMKKAAMLLGQKKFTIAEVMYMVGFSNHSYFSKCFQAVFQKTPLLFREEEEKKRSMWDQK